MNPITLFLLTAVALGFLGPVLTILSVVGKASQGRAKGNERERLLQIREADAMRRRELHEAKIAREHNAVILQDLKIEIERLKLEAAIKELAPPDFQTGEYSSDREPFTPPIS